MVQVSPAPLCVGALKQARERLFIDILFCLSVLREFDPEYDNLAVESRDLAFRRRATPLWDALKAECARIKVRPTTVPIRKLKH